MTEKKKNNIASIRSLARFSEISFRDLAVTAGPLVLITAVVIVSAYWYVRPAPPNTITIISGPAGSVFQRTAEKYRKILARDDIKLQILPSEGSLENLKKLNDPYGSRRRRICAGWSINRDSVGKVGFSRKRFP